MKLDIEMIQLFRKCQGCLQGKLQIHIVFSKTFKHYLTLTVFRYNILYYLVSLHVCVCICVWCEREEMVQLGMDTFLDTDELMETIALHSLTFWPPSISACNSKSHTLFREVMHCRFLRKNAKSQ